MRKTLTSTIAVMACGLLGVLLASDASWAKPKKGSTYLLCKCTCFAQDAEGHDHWGNPGGIWYTTSHDSCDSFHSCKVGKLTGIANDCSGHQYSDIKPGLKSTAPPATSTR